MSTFLRYFLVILFVVLTGVLCTLPNFHPEHYLGTGYHWWLDMMIHGGYYFLLSVLLYSFYKKEKRPAYLFVSILLFSYILELAQKEVPGRSFSGLDFLSNTIGVGLAWGFCVLKRKRARLASVQ
ncbi:VanZ family protein [Flavisolibacter ginsengisoli]|jgi:VanZ family protein|uniref:VanZ like family protein n=1 Tax=Flavisolibacter ginsengisoli DSM 18119 TaxID=1121884 RepID=A0A1M5E319_9BACT|nr:VanZ family protein [Flavisolibacter ginsengisoli]SHF73472.1 VanZ like family protein [Flavisolibacter ginsengisoli DSM 18119]